MAPEALVWTAHLPPGYSDAALAHSRPGMSPRLTAPGARAFCRRCVLTSNKPATRSPVSALHLPSGASSLLPPEPPPSACPHRLLPAPTLQRPPLSCQLLPTCKQTGFHPFPLLSRPSASGKMHPLSSCCVWPLLGSQFPLPQGSLSSQTLGSHRAFVHAVSTAPGVLSSTFDPANVPHTPCR